MFIFFVPHPRLQWSSAAWLIIKKKKNSLSFLSLGLQPRCSVGRQGRTARLWVWGVSILLRCHRGLISAAVCFGAQWRKADWRHWQTRSTCDRQRTSLHKNNVCQLLKLARAGCVASNESVFLRRTNTRSGRTADESPQRQLPRVTLRKTKPPPSESDSCTASPTTKKN